MIINFKIKFVEILKKVLRIISTFLNFCNKLFNFFLNLSKII